MTLPPCSISYPSSFTSCERVNSSKLLCARKAEETSGPKDKPRVQTRRATRDSPQHKTSREMLESALSFSIHVCSLFHSARLIRSFLWRLSLCSLHASESWRHSSWPRVCLWRSVTISELEPDDLARHRPDEWLLCALAQQQRQKGARSLRVRLVTSKQSVDEKETLALCVFQATNDGNKREERGGEQKKMQGKGEEEGGETRETAARGDGAKGSQPRLLERKRAEEGREGGEEKKMQLRKAKGEEKGRSGVRRRVH